MEAQTVSSLKDLLFRYISKQHEFLKTLTLIYKVLTSRRSPPITMRILEQPFEAQALEQAHKDFKLKIKKCIKFSGAINYILNTFLTTFHTNYCHDFELQIDEIKPIKIFIDKTSTATESKRIQIIQDLKNIYKLEIERSGSFLVYQIVFLERLAQKEVSSEGLETDNWTDKLNKERCIRLVETWIMWLKIIPLLIDYEITSVSLDSFLDTTDAIHLYYWQVFVDMWTIRNECSTDFVKMVDQVIEKNFPGSPDLFKEGIKSKLFGLGHGKSIAYEIATDMYRQYLQYFDDEVYKRLIFKCARHIISQIFDLYVDMRRSISHFIRWFFGEDKFKIKLLKSLDSDFGLYFNKCLEILQKTKKLAMDSQELELSGLGLEFLCYDTVVELFDEISGFQEDFYHERDETICRLVNEHYAITKQIVNKDYHWFNIKAAEIMSKLGYTLDELPSVIYRDIAALFHARVEFFRITNSAMEGTNPDQQIVVWFQDYDKIVEKFQILEKTLLNALNGMELADNFLAVLTKISVEDILDDLTNSEAMVLNKKRGGSMAMAIIEELKSTRKSEFLTEDQTNPNEDSFLNDHNFRLLLPAERTMEK